MPDLHFSSGQHKNESVKGTFVLSSTLLTCSCWDKNRSRVWKTVPSQRKWECLECLTSWMSTFLRTLSRSHLIKSLNGYTRCECKPGINVVFTGIFTCWCVASLVGISCENHRNFARCPFYMQRVSLVLAHALAKVKNFKHVASKTQRVHATVFSGLHEPC